MMKAYICSPEQLAEEAKMLAEAGVDIITIMDSAGTMYPHETTSYVKALKEKAGIPVGFHGHSNLGLSQANALAAAEAGADEVDGGLLGMARSAGNCATELAVATLSHQGLLDGVDLYKLLRYEDEELIPAMGCTEPIAIAYAGALARKTLERLPERIELTVSGNIIKNVKSVIVPNTVGLRGI